MRWRCSARTHDFGVTNVTNPDLAPPVTLFPTGHAHSRLVAGVSASTPTWRAGTPSPRVTGRSRRLNLEVLRERAERTAGIVASVHIVLPRREGVRQGLVHFDRLRGHGIHPFRWFGAPPVRTRIAIRRLATVGSNTRAALPGCATPGTAPSVSHWRVSRWTTWRRSSNSRPATAG
jgi:hypothetical protein